MPRAKKIFDPLGPEKVEFAADDLKSIMDFADRSGIDPHILVGLGETRDSKSGQTIIFRASYGQRKDSPPSRRNKTYE
jgi:hypothetical protein